MFGVIKQTVVRTIIGLGEGRWACALLPTRSRCASPGPNILGVTLRIMARTMSSRTGIVEGPICQIETHLALREYMTVHIMNGE